MGIHLNDTDYDAEAIKEHRQLLIQLRDEALKQNDFYWSLILSVTVGLLYELAKRVEQEDATA